LSWREIPAVPTGAFKELPLRCFPPERALHVFRTSGTSLARRGELQLDTLALYEASLRASFERGVLPDLADGERLPMLVLAPSPAELPDSSLSHMFGVMLERRGAPGSDFFLRQGELAVDALLDALVQVVTAPKLLLCGTAFAFVHFLEALEQRGLRLGLPPGTRVLETGGMKGRARELPRGMEPGLEATSYFSPPEYTYPFGAHVCTVEVDRETGEISILRYVAVDDCGRVINPMLVEGQVHGGIAQGIGQALYEEVVYDEGGQCLSGTLMDYAVPKAGQLPRYDCSRTETPTNVNPLGVKGVGEAGTIGATPTVVNAVLDALAPYGVVNLDMPLKPEKIWRALHQSRDR